MAEMITEAAILTQQAAQFDQIASGLSQERNFVNSIGQSFQNTWEGQAASAALGALGRFDEAMQDQIRQLESIVDKLNRSGGNYTKTDDEANQLLSSKMNF